MINISANIAGHALMLWSPVALPTGSIAVDQLELAQVVGAEWEACATVTAQFWIKPSEIYEAEFENNVAVIPPEVLSGVGLLHIAVYGSDAAGTKRISTNTVTMPITQGSFTEASAPAPSASLFEQAVDAALAGAIAQSGHYTKPANGIPETHLASDVQIKLARANSAQPMLTAGAGINIDNNNVISATGLSNDAKQALLALLERVAYIDDDGQDYYDALEAALYPPANLVSIAAVFTQGQNVIYDTDSLDTLKQYLVVTATYSDATSETITDYTLSGTLQVGQSTITVTYRTKTDTFVATVTSGTVIVDGTTLTWERGYIDANGNIAIDGGATGGYTSGYYEVSGYQTALVELPGSSLQRNAYYDSNKTFISRVLTAESEIPNGAVYARASIVKNSLGNAGYDGTGATITLT